MEHFDDSIALAPDPRQIADRLIETLDDFTHLKEAAPTLLFLFSERAIPFRGGLAWAVILFPRWQGPAGLIAAWLVAQFGAGQLGAALDPDYVVLFDAARWRSLDAERRERLVFHELSHLAAVEDEFGVIRRNRETGKPLLKLAPHSYEYFDAEIRRYGLDTCEADGLAHAIVEGEAQTRRRTLRQA